MPLPNVYRYEFDKSGQNPNNLVSNESHTTTQRIRKVIVPHYGHFYTNSVVITDVKTGQVLPSSAYFFDDISETIAMLTGLPAAMVIIIKDQTTSNQFSVTYQAVGGQFSHADIPLLAKKLEEAHLDTRPVDWNNIANKPSSFNPAEHLHPIWQTFGYQHLVYVVERLVQATHLGDERSHEVIWEALERLRQLIETKVGGNDQKVNQFIIDFNAKIEELKRRVKAVEDNKLGKTETAADTSKFNNKDYNTVKTEFENGTITRGLRTFVNNGNGNRQSANDIVKIGKTTDGKLLAASVGDEDYGNLFLVRNSLGTTDLDSLKTASHVGIHDQDDDGSATAARHYPTTRAGNLLVLRTMNGVQQIYFPYSGDEVYKRGMKGNGTWNDWIQVSNYRKDMTSALNTDDETKIATAKAVKQLKDLIDSSISTLTNRLFDTNTGKLKESIVPPPRWQ